MQKHLFSIILPCERRLVKIPPGINVRPSPLLVTLKPLLLVSSLHLEQCGVGGGDHQEGGGGKCGLGYFPNATRTFPSSPPSGVKAEVAALSLGDWRRRRRRRPVPGWQRKCWKQPKKSGELLLTCNMGEATSSLL